jgi:thioredoxin-related protein
MRGVYESNITLFSLSGIKKPKSISELQEIKKSETVKLQVPNEYLPGDFVLRFNYKNEKGSLQSHSEMNIIVSDQDLELWVNPGYCSNSDSTWFQPGERENSAFALFSKENNQIKEKLEPLNKFLMTYDDTRSKFYSQGIEEYEKKRKAYNLWLDTYVKKDRTLFVSHRYQFQHIPQMKWNGMEKDRIFSLIHHYFEGVDLSDPLITKTIQLNEWMNHYVNFYLKMATTAALRDSLLSLAARNAIEKAKQGSHMVYGWMVDYFYKGFESRDIPEGMKVLEPYLKDSNCLTSKRMEIERRLKGMETLVKGSKAPDIMFGDADSNLFQLSKYEPPSKYILLLFWSAECSHCTETVNSLYSWQIQPGIHQKISIVAISLDETETEVKAWDQKIKNLVGWKHFRAPEGIRSKVASDYFILATPIMILLDAKTKEIISSPSTFAQLKNNLP